MILVAGIDSGSVVQEQLGHLHRSRAMQRSPRIHPLGFDERRICGQHLRELIGEPCLSGLVYGQVCVLMRHRHSVPG